MVSAEIRSKGPRGPCVVFLVLVPEILTGTVRTRGTDGARRSRGITQFLAALHARPNGTRGRVRPRFYALMRGEGLPTPVRKENSPERREPL